MVRGLFTILAAALCSITQVQADPITYSLTTDASGTLGGSSFTDALVTVTLTGDTANVVPGPVPYTDTAVNSGSAEVSVSGLGTGTFTDPIVILSTLNDATLTTFFGSPTVLILDNASGTGILLQTGAIFSTYGLQGPLGPISGTGGVASGSHITPVFPTTAGDLTWAIGQPLGTSTFTAVTTAVPEPGAWLLLSSVLAAVLAVRRSVFFR
jgi:hypothetical protein